MPPKVDVKTLASKMENSGEIFHELIEEFEIIFSVKPELKTLEAAFHQVETRYRLIKKQQFNLRILVFFPFDLWPARFALGQ